MNYSDCMSPVPGYNRGKFCGPYPSEGGSVGGRISRTKASIDEPAEGFVLVLLVSKCIIWSAMSSVPGCSRGKLCGPTHSEKA